jgi:hypothetical protein
MVRDYDGLENKSGLFSHFNKPTREMEREAA